MSETPRRREIVAPIDFFLPQLARVFVIQHVRRWSQNTAFGIKYCDSSSPKLMLYMLTAGTKRYWPEAICAVSQDQVPGAKQVFLTCCPSV
ncbi:hypothetical protein DMENIID0001_136680 [Sergentomyia squamirostris]